MKLADLLDTTPAVLVPRLIIGGVALVVVIAFCWLFYYEVFVAPAKARAEAAQSHAAAVVSGGDAKAAQDAVAVVAAQSTKDASTDAQTRTNGDAISKAHGSSASVDPALDLAGRLSLCRRQVYSGSAACVALLKSHP